MIVTELPFLNNQISNTAYISNNKKKKEALSEILEYDKLSKPDKKKRGWGLEMTMYLLSKMCDLCFQFFLSFGRSWYSCRNLFGWRRSGCWCWSLGGSGAKPGCSCSTFWSNSREKSLWLKRHWGRFCSVRVSPSLSNTDKVKNEERNKKSFSRNTVTDLYHFPSNSHDAVQMLV